MRPTRTFSSELLGTEGAALFSWSPSADLLAAASYRRKKVVLFDRNGDVYANLTVPDPEYLYDESQETPVLALSWHPSGSHLAILPRGQPFVMVWSMTGELARVDSGVKPAEVQAMAWNPAGLQLALGTAKGTAIILDLVTRTVMPLQLGRSNKPVCCMAWSASAWPAGLLALGCKGGGLVLCRAADGASVKTMQMKAAVSQLQFCDPPLSEDGETRPATATPGGCSLLAANVGRRSVCIWQLPQALSADSTGSGGAFELAFREAYGEVEQYCWLSRNLLVAGFSMGQLVAVALSGGLHQGSGTGTELFSSRAVQQGVSSLSWCAATSTLAAGSGRQLALLNCTLEGPEAPLVVQQPGLIELEGAHRVASLECSPCGRFLTVASQSGKLLQLLAKPPLLHGVCGGQLSFVDPTSSLTQALLVQISSLQPGGKPATTSQQQAVVAVMLPAEPEQLALGPTHLAVAQGNKVWLQALEPSPGTGLLPPSTEVDFPTDIHWLRLNRTCVLLLDEGGRVFVQLGMDGGSEVVELRGEGGEPFSACCAALTERCILLGLPNGTLASYHCSDATLLSKYHHGGNGITALYPNHDGTMVLFQDAERAAVLYHTVKGQLMPLPDYFGELKAAVWDGGDSRVLAAVNEEGLAHVYCHVPCSVQGPGVKLVGTHQVVKGAVPLALLNGALTQQLPDGHLDTQLLTTHLHLADASEATTGGSSDSNSPQIGRGSTPAPAFAEMSRKELLTARCQEALALCHFQAALSAARTLGDPQMLRELALAALQFMEVRVAVAAYEVVGDEEPLAQLRPLLEMEDEHLVTGHVIAITGGDADRAEQLLLSSCRPTEAITMRRNLGHWERAIELTQQLEPHAVGSLALLRAQALEAAAQVEAAMSMYQQALAEPDLITGGAAAARQRRADCDAGVTRCNILLGDIEQGMEMAIGSGSTELVLQCAALLDQEQRPKEAGQLYARAEQYERAARLFLSCREFSLLDGVMEHAGSPELWLKYAQTKEDLGSFRDAVRAYKQARDIHAAVRVLLDRLEDAESAARLARQAQSAEMSLTVARFCERSGKLELAMEMYCAGGNCTAAFLVAQRNSCVGAFADWARRNRSVEAAQLAATHYEVDKQLGLAAEMTALAGNHEQAVRLYLQAGGNSIAGAIRLAAEVKDPAVVALVLEHLQAADGMGAALLELHLALDNLEDACAVAVVRAQQEQANGNYKVARDQLLHVCLELQQRNAAAPPPLLSTLHLLHSYLLVRQLVRQGDHLSAARLLLVVSENIQSFPRHVVPILTSTVIECHRASLHGPAQRWAAVLMDQYASQVSAAYAKKIEAIAKQPAWTSEGQAAEPQGECLFCGVPGPETSLTCSACQRTLPFCAASSKRMLLGDWSECPRCRFPCRGRDMTRCASVERSCPLCEAAVEVHDIRRIFDPIAHCRRTVFSGMLAGSQKERR